jgi:hypothetical protein
LVVLFAVTQYEGEINPNDEVDQWGWYSAKSLPKPMLRSHPIRVEDAIAKSSHVFVR